MNTVSDINGKVFDIQRFSLHDGPGIRTTVFLKGCPLKCAWCHNPESWKNEAELFYHEKNCIGCGECAAVCKPQAHSLKDGIHAFERTKCGSCFACAEACPTGAVEVSGMDKSVAEVIEAVLRDSEFYKNGGGMTVSGGEPFMQSTFLLGLLKAAKSAGLHTCIETSGAANFDDMLAAKEFTDIFLYDCKMIPGEEHRKYVGNDGIKLHDNLKRLDKSGAKIILRCPIIPGVNDNDKHFAYVAELANSLDNLLEIHLQPYHTTGIAKAKDIGKNDIFSVDNFNKKEFVSHIENRLLPIIKNAVSKCKIVIST